MAKGLHEYLWLQVVWPPTEDFDTDFALAVSPDVFGDFAGHPDNKIKIEPRVIGGVVLREGHLLGAYGNTKSHSGSEVQPVYIEILEDEKQADDQRQ